MEIVAKTLLLVGFVGVLVAALLNAYVVVGLGRKDAMLFASRWWSGWFPLYLVMITVAFIGLVLTITGK